MSGAEVTRSSDPGRVLTDRHAEIVALARRHGVVAMRVFGSVARGDQRPDSDLDLLVDFAPGVSLYDQARFEKEIRALLGISVDVISAAALLPSDADIVTDAIAVDM